MSISRFAVCSLFALALSVPAAVEIIPRPMNVKELPGAFTLKRNTVVSYADPAARDSAEMLAAQLRPATGFPLPVRAGIRGDIVLRTVSDSTLGEEGYFLQVTPKRIRLTAPASAGLFYGAQTLRQLLPPRIYADRKQPGPWTVPAVEIRDRPRFRWRGLMLDVSRHFIPKEDVMRFIDIMAAFKLNTFHWHLTDDQGWRIEIRKYPRLTEVGAWRKETLVGHLKHKPRRYDGKRYGGFYTQADIREVVAYAAARHVTIVPEIDMPGHMQAAIAAYPELGCTSNRVPVKCEWGVSLHILNPEESTIAFCEDVLREVMELFPSEYIHIGGDEARKDEWKANPRIRRLLRKRGLKDMDEMQTWFVSRIADFLRRHGRRPVGWDEILDDGLPKDVVVMWWRGWGRRGKEIPKKAIRTGHDVVNASTTHLYFDYYQSADHRHEPLAIGGLLPLRKVYGYDPAIEGLSDAENRHVLGAQGQIWTEYIPDLPSVEYMAFPRALALAELTWTSAERKDYDDFLRRVRLQQKRFDFMGVRYRPVSSAQPEGKGK